jgi:hypothetical protein
LIDKLVAAAIVGDQQKRAIRQRGVEFRQAIELQRH